MKVFLTLRVFLIFSFLGLLAPPSFSFFQNAESKVRAKIKYEFTDTRISEADTLLKNRKYNDALAAYQEAYDTYESESFYEGMVYAKERMGRTYRSLGKDSLSRVTYQASAELSREKLGPNHILESKAYLNNGVRAHFEGQSVSASKFLDSSKLVYDKSFWYDSTILKNVIDFKFYTYYYSGLSSDTLVKYLNEKGRYYESSGSTLEQNIYLLLDYNRAYYRIGDYQKSVAYGLEAVRQSEEGSELIKPVFYTDALFHLGRSLYAQGKYERALSVSDRLIKYALKNDPEGRDLTSYFNLKAVTLNLLEKYQEAASEFLGILEILEKRDNKSVFYIDVVMNLGVCYQRMGDYDRAEEYLFKALRLQKEISNVLDISFVNRYRYIGQLYASQKNNNKALIYYDSALRNGIPTYKGTILEFPSESFFNATYEILTILKNKQLNLGNTYSDESTQSLQILEAIVEYGESTHEYLVSNREEFRASEGKLFLSDNFKSMYGSILNANYLIYKMDSTNVLSQERAIRTLSLSKANLFLEQSGELEQIQDSRLSQETKNVYFRLQSKIDSLEAGFYKLIEDIATSDSIRKINLELLELRGKKENLADSIKRIIGVTDKNENINSSVNNHLKRETDKAIIEFFVGEDYTFIIGKTHNKVVFKRISLDSVFNKHFNRMLHQISKRPSLIKYEQLLEEYDSSASVVYSYLLKDVLASLGDSISKLTLIPDEMLSRLPFEALVQSRSKKSRYFSDLDYLLEHYVINYSLSSSEINDSLSRRVAKKRLLGIGYSGGPFTDENGSGYGALLGTEEEIKYLQERVDGDYFLGQDGSKESFLKRAKDYDVLHLAVHGQSDSSDRYQSSLIFSGYENNVLRTSDLYVAGLSARLAILSACESGVGEINKGEGTFSIARGFALVGVPSIVMSLWKVNDEETSKLMSSLHRNLQMGQSVEFALTNAKREYLFNSEQFTSHPYYWSTFVSLGEEVVIADEEGSFLAGFIILAGVGLLFIILYRVVYKRKGVN